MGSTGGTRDAGDVSDGGDTAAFYQPAPSVRIGIAGGPILHDAIVDNLDRLHRDPDRYIAFVSLLAPSSQKLAAAVLWSGASEFATVVDVARGVELQTDAEGTVHETLLGDRAEQVRLAARSLAGIRLPALVDTATGAVSNNVYALPWLIATQLASAGSPLASAADETPNDRQARVEREEQIFTRLHAGVYRAGFLTDQGEYDLQVDDTGAYLAELDAALSDQPYLSGSRPGLDDLWAFTLIVRFDHVYGPLFRLHRHRITDHPALLAWARRLYADPVLRATTDFDAITQGYYHGIPQLRREVVPQGVRDRHLLTHE